MSSETSEVHTRVASLLRYDGWLYHHEYTFADRSRVDFVAIQPRTARLAVIECKTSITSVHNLIEQLNGYHQQFGYSKALKWVFVLNTPLNRTIKYLALRGICVFPLDQEPDAYPDEIDPQAREKFRKAFNEFKPLLQELDMIEAQRFDVLSRMKAIAFE